MIRRTMALSSMHVSPDARRYMDEAARYELQRLTEHTCWPPGMGFPQAWRPLALPVYPFPEGWIVSASTEEEDPEEAWLASGVPAELVEVLLFARAAGCDYLLFDADAPEVDDLPTYDADW